MECQGVMSDKSTDGQSAAHSRPVRQNIEDNNSVASTDALIHELFEEQAKRAPDSVALSSADEYVTYAKLDCMGNQVARTLLACGAGPERRIGLYAERSIEAVVGLLGILKSGAAYVPLDPNYPKERIAFMIEDASLTAILSQPRLSGDLANSPARVIVFGDEMRESDEKPVVNNLSPRTLAYVIYTSGSTGRPKGVMIEHRSVLSRALNTYCAPISRGDCIANCASLSFDATTWEVWAALLNGARLHIVPNFSLLNASVLNDTLTRQHVTAMFLTVGLFNELVDRHNLSFARLNHLLVGGDVVNPAPVARALAKPGAPSCIVNAYGPTETTTFATMFPIRSLTDSQESLPIGRPIGNDS